MANNIKKVTKHDNLEGIAAVLDAAQKNGITLDMGDVTYDTMQEYVTNEIELLAKKAEAAQKRAAEKKQAGDELREKIFAVLTNTAQSIADIVKATGIPDLTPQMATSRLAQLADPEVGKAVKEDVEIKLSDGKTKKVSGYRLA